MNAGQLGSVAKTLSETGLRVAGGETATKQAAKTVSSTELATLFPLSARAQALRKSLVEFMGEHVYPAEKVWVSQLQAQSSRWGTIPPVLEQLKVEAKRRGLWNLFLSDISGLSQVEYAQLAEVMGGSPLASEVQCQEKSETLSG